MAEGEISAKALQPSPHQCMILDVRFSNQSLPNTSTTHVMYPYRSDDPELARIKHFESDDDFGL